MGIADKLQGSFSSLPPFAAALSAGVQDELAPVYERMAQLEAAITQLGGQVSAASAAAAAAAAAAEAARNAAQTPTPSQSATTSTSGGNPPAPSPSAGTTSVPTPTPTPSSTPRPTLLVIALASPIFVGDIFNGGFRQTAAIGITPKEGAFYVGSEMELSVSNVDSTVEFVNWTNSAGELLGGSPTLTTTVTEANSSIAANFRTKSTTSTDGTTGGTTTGGTGGSGGGGGSLGDETGGSIEERNRI